MLGLMKMTMTGNEIFFEFNIWDYLGVAKPKQGVLQLKRELKDFLLTAVLDRVGGGTSPVSGGKWKRALISKAYKDHKSGFSSSLFANMELTGEMLDHLEVISIGDDMRLRIKGKNAAKADGHNNHSGDSNLPTRLFIPKKGQRFKRDINSGMREIALEFLDNG